MPLIHRTLAAPVSGTVYSLYLKKPVGETAIKKITISSGFATSFVKIDGWLYNLSTGKTNEKIGLYNKFCPTIFSNFTAFKGEQKWPHNFRMWLRARSQNTNGRFYFTIEHEIIKPTDPRRRRWGE